MSLVLRVFLALFLLTLTGSAFAGGAIKVDINGLPLMWDTNSILEYNLEGGALKSNGEFPRQETVDLVNTAFSRWSSLPGNKLEILRGPDLDDGGDINPSNYQQFLGSGTEECYPDIFGTPGDCLTPIIFDEDGEILDSLFGSCAKFSILGFAGPDDVEDGSGDSERRIVRRGQALFSGACLPPAETKLGCGSCQRVLTVQEITTIITHELGHLMGMDHSQVNPNIFEQCTVAPDGCPPEVSRALPTMFPILVNGAIMEFPHNDDIAYFLHLYGDSSGDSCTVSGTVFASDGTTEVRGVEVVARNVDSELELSDAISFVSGAEAPKINSSSRSQGNCRESCGFYRITELGPGETYQLCVQKINSQFTGGSSIEPVDPPFQKFSDDCPEGLTVTCECDDNGGCKDITGVNIITDADAGDIEQGVEDPSEENFGDSESSGGCSLMKPLRVKTYFWERVVRAVSLIR